MNLNVTLKDFIHRLKVTHNFVKIVYFASLYNNQQRDALFDGLYPTISSTELLLCVLLDPTLKDKFFTWYQVQLCV